MNGKVEDRSRSGIREEPITLEVTTRCDSRCRHCFVRAGKRDRARLSLDLARGIVTEGYGAGYRHLHLTGGEPLLWEGLFPTLDHALATGYRRISKNLSC